MSELKRCPFCGCELYYEPEWNSGNHLHCRNNECVIECSFDSFNEIEKAINTRPIEDELQAELSAEVKDHQATMQEMERQDSEIERLKSLLSEALPHVNGDTSRREGLMTEIAVALKGEPHD